MANILLVEDDLKLNQIICSYLFRSGYKVTSAQNPVEGFNLINTQMFDLVISDIMMPKIDGFTFAEKIRAQNPQIPILFISALDDLNSKKRGFNLGIDDYMVKPIDMDELVLRVGSLLRRAFISSQNVLIVGDTKLVKDQMSAYIGDVEVDISPKEFSILFKLLSYPKKIFTRSQLLDEFWGMTNESGLRTVDVYITKLRKEFAKSKSFEIQTVHGFGYKAVLK